MPYCAVDPRPSGHAAGIDGAGSLPAAGTPGGTAEPASSPANGRAAWRAAGPILAVRLDNLGDVLMTTPALAALASPDNADDPARRRVTLLTSRAGAVVAGRVPQLADVIAWDAPWVKGPVAGARAERALVARLARRRFEAAVIFTVCTQSALPAALLCRLAGIPLRLAASRENPYALLTDVVRDTETVGDGMRHEVDRQLDLVRSVGCASDPAARLVFRPTPADVSGTRTALAGAGLAPDAGYLVVHPGSTAESRRWPAGRFGVAAGRIAAASGLRIVVAGGPDDLAAAAAVQAAAAQVQAAAGPGAVSLAGALGLGELAALIAGARLLLCNNSGPAHLAAALGTPVVVLYALTNPQHTPWRVASRVLSHEVPCRHCLRSVCPERHHRCLLGVEPDAVVAAALDLLREAAFAPRSPSVTEAVSTCRPRPESRARGTPR